MNRYIFPFLWMRGEPEAVIREEMQKIYDCGIRAVCVEARPHKDFCGPGWWHDLDIVIEEAKKKDMKIWILDDKHFPTGYAAGLIKQKYPERKKQYLACSTADLFGGRHIRTLAVDRMLKPTIGFWQIGAQADWEERKNNCLLAIVAVRFAQENGFEETCIDLTGCYKDGYAVFELPKGQWRVYVIYITRTDGGNDTYINMLDPVSAHTQIEGVYEAHYAHYAEEFGRTIAGFFSDEPQIGNTAEQCFDTKLGKKGMQLPWSARMEEILRERYGQEYRTYLPFLFAKSAEMKICPQIRYDYMDVVSGLYEQHFSRPIGDWCREHGVEYIGHVVEDNGVHSRLGLGAAHYFRAMAGQDMAGIDVIGGQVMFGAPVQTRVGMGGMEGDGEFFHYVLGKLGASSAHLDPKKKGRCMCELFGAYGWGFGVRDMKYLLDHMLLRGVNHLVPHAFSMAEYPDVDCPPHFYARGNNPQFLWFAELTQYADRMCGLLNGGTHAASVAVLYDGEADWAGDHMKMQKVARILMEHQIGFDFICMDMLRNLQEYNGFVKGKKLVMNGVEFDALIVPYCEFLVDDLVHFVCSHARFPVIFVGGFPARILRGGCTPAESFGNWRDYCRNVELDKLPETLWQSGFYKIKAEPSFSQLAVYHYKKDRQLFLVSNESAQQAFRGRIMLPTEKEIVCYDAWTDCVERLSNDHAAGITWVELTLEPGESCVLMEHAGEDVKKPHIFFCMQRQMCDEEIDLSHNWQVETVSAAQYPNFTSEETMKELVPVSEFDAAFSGIIRYKKTVFLRQKPERAVLYAEHVYSAMRVFVNGKLAGSRLTPPYQIDAARYLREGENIISIEVATTLEREQLRSPAAPFDFTYEALEPTGMFGNVTLYVKEKTNEA